MFTWLSRKENASPPELFQSVSDGLYKVYESKLLPLEQVSHFHELHLPQLHLQDFQAKPMVLLVGQYSTGKTTFIRYLLEQDFPGMRIGPDPTSDKFTAVMYDETPGVVPGNAVVLDPNKPFGPLSQFGNALLGRFQCSLLNSPVLQSISFVDTPGILSDDRHTADCSYDFTQVLQWFASRADRVLLMFDANKLDISDQLTRFIASLRGQDDKIRIVLNKADLVDQEQLMTVYGSLMWSLGKILRTPEAVRVYVGSLWDQPLRCEATRRLFEVDERELFRDIRMLPRGIAVRRVDEMVRRARLAKVHAYVVTALSRSAPQLLGARWRRRSLQHLDRIYERLQREYQIPLGDFPDLEVMRERLSRSDIGTLKGVTSQMLRAVDRMLAEDIPRIMDMIPMEPDEAGVRGGVFRTMSDTSPFGFRRAEGIDEGSGESQWVVNRNRRCYDALFDALGPVGSKLTGAAVKQEMLKSKLPSSVLSRIWKLSDVDRDGLLDAEEFALAMHLIRVKCDGYELPCELPPHLVPPSKRKLFCSNTSLSRDACTCTTGTE